MDCGDAGAGPPLGERRPREPAAQQCERFRLTSSGRCSRGGRNTDNSPVPGIYKGCEKIPLGASTTQGWVALLLEKNAFCSPATAWLCSLHTMHSSRGMETSCQCFIALILLQSASQSVSEVPSKFCLRSLGSRPSDGISNIAPPNRPESLPNAVSSRAL